MGFRVWGLGLRVREDPWSFPKSGGKFKGYIGVSMGMS